MKTKLMVALATATMMSSVSVAHAQTASGDTAASQASTSGQVGPVDALPDTSHHKDNFLTGDGPVTWNGITLFGTLDAGLSYASHGAPNSGGFYAGDILLQKFYNKATWSMAPSGLSQSTIGIKGSENILPGVNAVFMASTGFNPQSGQLANAGGSQVANNGVPLAGQSMNIDGTRGGQAFNDQLYAGISSKIYGELTFGRHKTFSNDLLANYDPAGAAYDYSPIGYSGTPVAGLGETDLGREDETLKYNVSFPTTASGIASHFGAMYKFAQGNAGIGGDCGGTTPTTAIACHLHNNGYQIDAGAAFHGFEMDGVFSHYNQALTYGTLGVGTTSVLGNVEQNLGNTGLAGTVADITSWMLAGKYTWQQVKLYAGYAHDRFSNPSDPMGVGANTGQGDFSVIAVNNAAFPNDKTYQTMWLGVKYSFTPKTDFTLAYYHEHQNAFGTSAQLLTCGNSQASRSGNCSGNLDAISGYVDHHFTKRFDTYGGVMWSKVNGGVAAGYLQDQNFAPTLGARFSF